MANKDKIFSVMKAVASSIEEKPNNEIPAAKLTEEEVKFIKEIIKQMNEGKAD